MYSLVFIEKHNDAGDAGWGQCSICRVRSNFMELMKTALGTAYFYNHTQHRLQKI